jgi:mycothiol synthase
MLETVWTDELDEATTGELRELLLAARATDGRPDLDGPGLPGEFTGGRHLLAREDGVLAGYAHLDIEGDAFGRRVGELIVRPDRRRRGIGTALARSLVDEGGAGLRVWAHGDHPGAARLAAKTGFSRVRELLVMHVSAEGADWPEPSPREGVTLRRFVPGQDEQAVVDVNAKAFDWHPEQGTLSVADLREAEAEDWFDPRGFFLAEESGRVVGFHWTKVHPANPRRFGGEPAGEVYVVGVDPAAQGGGLGRALTVAGLRHLRDAGLGQVILYVEGDNGPAVAVYERLGFTRYEVDVQYAR